MVVDDIVINKTKAIERCLQRIEACFAGKEDHILSDPIRQDAITLNLQRACENAIDLATHILRKKQFGIPQSSRDAFELLAEKSIISRDLLAKTSRHLQGLPG